MDEVCPLCTPCRPTGDGDVLRVIYASQACVAGPVYAQMESIRAAAVRHNTLAGVCTALLHQSHWFLQWKEGPEPELMRIMDRVERDRRHHSLRIVHSSRGPRLLCGLWSMGVVQGEDDPDRMSQRVLRLRRAMLEGTPVPPAAAWRQLSSPLGLPGTPEGPADDAFQRVLVCASAGQSSFDLVRWLAGCAGRPMVHRRFAGAEGADVGTDTLDLQEGGRALRVMAMARGGLALPLTRAFLSDYSHVVLLLEGDRERQSALVQRLGQACAGLRARPVVVGVSPDLSMQGPLFTLARRAGLIYLPATAQPAHCAGVWAAVQPLLSHWPVQPARGPSSVDSASAVCTGMRQ